MNMNIKILLAAVLSVAFISSAAANDIADTAQERKKKFKLTVITKQELKKQNAGLKCELDSVRAELERYRQELAAADSVNNEILSIYGVNDNMNDCGILPEEYTADVSDSLLNLWYAHRMVNDSEDIEAFNMDSVKLESNIPDNVYIERLEKMNSFITLPYNDVVRNYIILYSEKMPTKVSHILGLCNYYMPIFQEVLNKYNLPEELKAMAVIESALNPVAVSRAGA